MKAQISKNLHIFYCHADQDKKFYYDLIAHMSNLKQQIHFTSSDNYMVFPGRNWEKEITTHINNAEIIILLISPDFMASNQCYGIMQYALKKQVVDKTCVIPILLRPGDWKYAPFSHLQVLPTNRKPISQWRNHDEAFAEIAEQIRVEAENLICSQTLPIINNIQGTFINQTPSNTINTQNISKNSLISSHYNKRTIALLVVVYAIACAFMTFYSIISEGINTASTNTGLANIASSIGTALFLIIGIPVLVLDWSRATTLYGRINWQSMRGKKLFWLLSLYIVGFVPIFLGAYLVLTVWIYYQTLKLNKQNAANKTP